MCVRLAVSEDESNVESCEFVFSFNRFRLGIFIIWVFFFFLIKNWTETQVYYYVVDSPRNEGKDYFEINTETGEVFTKIIFDREKQGAYALEVEARDGAPSARPNNENDPNSGTRAWTTNGQNRYFFL